MQYIMETQDYFHAISERSLKDEINSAKRRLTEIYIESCIALNGNALNREQLTKSADQFFSKTYTETSQKLLSGQPGMDCAQKIEETILRNFQSDANSLYRVAFILIACADLLEKEGLREKSWSALLEFAYYASCLDQACEANLKRIEKERHQENGGQANRGFLGLHEYFDKILSSTPPKKIFTSMKSAADELVNDVWEYQRSSEYHGKLFKNKDALNTRLSTWLKTGHTRNLYMKQKQYNNR